MSEQSSVRYDVSDGVATITLDRPEAMNALDVATKVDLRDAVTAAAGDEAVRCVLLTGSGRAFCVGQDLREHVELLQSQDGSLWRTVPEHYNPIALALATMPKPVVAAVNGVAAGAGAAFAMAADIRLVAASAGFNLAFAGVALSADSGSSWWLPRLVGVTRAKELLLLPRTVPAEEALAIGLATEVVPDDELASRAGDVARRLAAGPTVAYGAIRRAVAFSATHDLEESLAHEAQLMALTGGTADHAEAVAAFLGKRAPAFTGR
ncbi:MAG: enoyl-CoA hydratase-related protein [Actinomycetota bacterium]